MTYVHIENFERGMDRRKRRITGIPGSLWTLKNAHITRGGEIERAKKPVSTYALPAGTFDLAALGSQIYTFGHTTDPGVPSGVLYQRLAHVDDAIAMSEVLDVEVFDGKLYVVAEFVDGSVHHYYDGERVEAWDAVALSIGGNDSVAEALAVKVATNPAVTSAVAVDNVITITAAGSGDISIGAFAFNFGAVDDQTAEVAVTQPAVAPVSAVSATTQIQVVSGTESAGTNKITSIKVDGVEILDASIDWATSNSATASALAAQIVTTTSSPEYTATAVGPVITITSTTTGAAVNGFVVSVTTAGDVAISGAVGTADGATNDVAVMAGGVTNVSAVSKVVEVTIGGTFEPADQFEISIGGTSYYVRGLASGTGRTALTYKSKMHSLTADFDVFSGLNNPLAWDQNDPIIDAGFLNLTAKSSVNEPFVVAREYQTFLAYFSQSSVQIWSIDEDSAANQFIQALKNTGTLAPKSAVSYGNSDLFYLDNSGVRSVRARDASNAAFVSDVGSALDPFIQEYLATLTSTQRRKAQGLIEPVDGRYWLAVGQRIFVFSFFPNAKISAWSYYDWGFPVDRLLRVGDRVYIRSGNTVYLYGGSAGATYPDADEYPVQVSLPFVTGGKPATRKTFNGFDVALEGTWLVKILPNPNDESAFVTVGTIDKSTYPQLRTTGHVQGTHFAVEMTCAAAGRATISDLALHFVEEFEPG